MHAAMKAGHDVLVAAPKDHISLLEDEGFSVTGLTMERGSINPTTDLKLFIDLCSVMKKFRPNVAHLITAKAIIFGGLAARLFGIPALGAFSGMGYVFSNDSGKAKFLQGPIVMLYRAACKPNNFIALFQNETDRGLSIAKKIVPRERTELISGSGTDLDKFDPNAPPKGTPTVILPARMLRDKGVHEFIIAARILLNRGYRARFILQGDPDPRNPTSFSESDLKSFSGEGAVEWHSHTNEIWKALACAHLVVLPSYYGEGLPKTLIDAAAAGRAIVTTDMPGCRDAIIPYTTGLLCKPKDPEDLARCIGELLDRPDRLVEMGRAARKYAEAHFNVVDVVQQHIELYERLARVN